ncbi:MAG: hypothetical protein OCD03_13220 [Hyphomicrobiales bacterium]
MRKTYIFDAVTQSMIEKPKQLKAPDSAPFLMPDIGEFEVNNTLISSRPQLREFEKQHNVIQTG